MNASDDPAGRLLPRRVVLSGMARLAGLAALPTLPALLQGCAPGSGPTAAPAGSEVASGATGVLRVGSNYADPLPKQGMQAIVDAFEAASGVRVAVNTVAANAFQDGISAYLQGTPDDVFTWFAGYRMRFFADRGLVGDVSDVWATAGANYTDGFRRASTGTDGRQYLVPTQNYPWVVLYRKSLWAKQGYPVPDTLDQLRALCDRMAADGLIPIAFGDKDGWPAMGTFDILNLRQNGYDFHIGLMDGRERWTDPRVRTIFERWRTLLPHHQKAALGRTWQDAARTMINGDAGMYFMGTFAGEQATEADRADLDMFPFPALGTAFDAERAIDAPINGFMLARHPANPDAAKAFLRFVARGATQERYVRANPNRVAAALDAPTDGYTDYQRRMAAVIASAGRIAQFLDRDTRPDFAGPNGMQRFLQDFLDDPEQDLDPFVAGIQAFWDSLT